MALLAESKKKVKYGLDPQNTNWSKDDSKFGQRMMERMGWTKGKGLGANESGMTEHIKASYKWDQRGLGSSAKSADAWVAHQDEFNDILKMLNSGKEAESMQEKDKSTQYLDGQKRYYGRFSRGRVQTLRTTDDLDCIFGRRKAASEPTTPLNQSAANSGDEENSVDIKDQSSGKRTEKSHGLTTVTSSTSVQDYFANKMKELQARKAKSAVSVDGQTAVPAEPALITSQPAVYGMVGFSYDEDKADRKEVDQETEKSCRGWYEEWNGVQEGADVNTTGTVKKQKKKKKKTKEREEEDLRQVTGDGCHDGTNEMVQASSADVDDQSCTTLDTHSVANDEGKLKKKKKSKKSKDVSDTVGDTEMLCNEKEDKNGSPLSGAKETINAIEDMVLSSTKREKRKMEQEKDEEIASKRTKLDGIEVESNTKPEIDTTFSSEGKVKKKKKKKQSKQDCFLSLQTLITSDELADMKKERRVDSKSVANDPEVIPLKDGNAETGDSYFGIKIPALQCIEELTSEEQKKILRKKKRKWESKKRAKDRVSELEKKVKDQVSESEKKVKDRVSESEKKVKDRVSESKKKVKDRVSESEKKVKDRVSESEKKVEDRVSGMFPGSNLGHIDGYGHFVNVDIQEGLKTISKAIEDSAEVEKNLKSQKKRKKRKRKKKSV